MNLERWVEMRADVQMSFNVKATCGYCVNLSFSTKCDWICLLDEDENITIDDIESCSCEKWKFNYSTLSTLRPDELEVKRVSSTLKKESK